MDKTQGMSKKPLTTDAIWSARGSSDTVITAGEIAEMRFMGERVLSLKTAKLFLLLLQEAGIKVTDDVQHRIPLSLLNETFHVSREAFQDAFEELEGQRVALRITPEGKRPYEKRGPIFSDIEEDEDSQGFKGLGAAEIRFRFSPTLRAAVQNSTHWAAISRRAVLAFESRYTLSLYTYLALRANRRNTSEDPLTIDELRSILNVPGGRLTNWSDLRRFALEQAKAEINQLAGFHFDYEAIKIGRKVGKVRLVWGRKDVTGLREAERAFQMTRAERTAHRRGIETIVDDRVEIAEGLVAISGKNIS